MAAAGVSGATKPMGPHSDPPPEIENVFYVVIDGARYSETLGDSAYAYANIPHLWNDLRPLGTILSSLYNTEMTNTTPSFHTVFTGQYVDGWNRLNNEPFGNLGSIIPMFPTIFELYRKEKVISAEKVWLVSGNGALRKANCSHFPGYGETFGASRSFNRPVSDDSVWTALQQVMDTHQPSLVVVNLGDTDLAAHTGDWLSYTSTIHRADSIVWELYKKIQAIPPYTDTHYKDRTVLFVATDHGRDQNNFTRHDRSDYGCRQITFLATGPVIRAGAEVGEFHELVDVCPTIGALLGFATPYAQGRVMSELFVPGILKIGQERIPPEGADSSTEQPTRVTDSPAIAETPTICHTTSGLHLAWCDTRTGLSRIHYARSSDGGSTWSPDTLLVDAFALFPRLASSGDTLLLCWSEYRDQGRTGANWELFSMRSCDGGQTWEPEIRLSPPMFGGIFPAPLITRNRAVTLLTVLPKYPSPLGRMQLAYRGSDDAGATWPDSALVTSPAARQPEAPSLVADSDGVLYAAWRSIEYYNWEIIFSKSTNGGRTWSTQTRLTDETHESYYPTIALAGSVLNVAWADLSSGTWQVYLKRSLDGGVSWSSDTPLTTSAAGAIQPILAAAGDTLHLFWVDYRDRDANLYHSASIDSGQSWTPETRLTWSDSISVYPAVCVNGQTAYLAWQDNRDGG
jgi:hypothetical protein